MLNRTEYQGRMIRDVELKETPGGIKYANFSIAWSEKYGEKENNCYLPCKAWRQPAEFVDKYFHSKGSEIIVEGHLETEQWEKDGQKQSRIVLMVDKAHFCGKKQDAQPTAEHNTPTPEAAGYVPADNEELPF